MLALLAFYFARPLRPGSTLGEHVMEHVIKDRVSTKYRKYQKIEKIAEIESFSSQLDREFFRPIQGT